MIDPSSGRRFVPKTSPVGQFAIAEFNHNVGYDIREVFEDAWWQVGITPGGDAGVLLAADGVRAMARFAPRPDASELVEQIITAARDKRNP